MATDTVFKMSFLKMMNNVKGINKPVEPTEVDPEWLEKRAPVVSRKKWQEYLSHYESVGVTHPKVKYPVMFGQGDNKYPGMLALEDIQPNEVICKVPGREIITTRAAFYSDI
jgi:hypothetical protein